MKKVVCPSCEKHDNFWVNDSELIDDFDAIYKNEKCECECGAKFKVSTTYKEYEWEYE